MKKGKNLLTSSKSKHSKVMKMEFPVYLMSVCDIIILFSLYDSYYELDFSSGSRAFASPSVQKVYP